MHDGAKGKDTDIWISCWDSLSQKALVVRDQTWGKDLGTVPSTARLGYSVACPIKEGTTQTISSCWLSPGGF